MNCRKCQRPRPAFPGWPGAAGPGWPAAQAGSAYTAAPDPPPPWAMGPAGPPQAWPVNPSVRPAKGKGAAQAGQKGGGGGVAPPRAAVPAPWAVPKREEKEEKLEKEERPVELQFKAAHDRLTSMKAQVLLAQQEKDRRDGLAEAALAAAREANSYLDEQLIFLKDKEEALGREQDLLDCLRMELAGQAVAGQSARAALATCRDLVGALGEVSLPVAVCPLLVRVKERLEVLLAEEMEAGRAGPRSGWAVPGPATPDPWGLAGLTAEQAAFLLHARGMEVDGGCLTASEPGDCQAGERPVEIGCRGAAGGPGSDLSAEEVEFVPVPAAEGAAEAGETQAETPQVPLLVPQAATCGGLLAPPVFAAAAATAVPAPGTPPRRPRVPEYPMNSPGSTRGRTRSPVVTPAQAGGLSPQGLDESAAKTGRGRGRPVSLAPGQQTTLFNWEARKAARSESVTTAGLARLEEVKAQLG